MDTRKNNSDTTKKLTRAFWITILFLLLLTIGLAFIGSIRSQDTNIETTLSEPAQQPLEIPLTKIEKFINAAAAEAYKKTLPEIETAMNEVYAPAYAAIPKYASFHYSVLGEYIEITNAARGIMAKEISKKLFAGFNDRFIQAATSLDNKYSNLFKNEIARIVDKELSSSELKVTLGPITQASIHDTVNRSKVTLPLATIAATLTTSALLKGTINSIAKKLSVKIASKAAAKGALKGGGVVSGVTGGVLICSWSGPLATLCGIGGGLAAWFIADAAVVNIDEYFNRSEFENDLKKLLDEDKKSKILEIQKALKNKSDNLQITPEKFTLEELSKSSKPQ